MSWRSDNADGLGAGLYHPNRRVGRRPKGQANVSLIERDHLYDL
jgi:hypothetical protein